MNTSSTIFGLVVVCLTLAVIGIPIFIAERRRQRSGFYGTTEMDTVTRVGLTEDGERAWRREQKREQGWVLAVLLAWVAGLVVGWLFLP